MRRRMSDPKSPRLPAAQNRDLATLAGRRWLPTELRDASGMKRLDYFLELAATSDFVGELATEELFLLIHDIGKEDAYPLLAHATQEQLQGLVDLDAWQKDSLVPARWLEWLDLALAVDMDTAVRFIEAQDDETLEWLFIQGVTIHGRDLDPSDVPDELQVVGSPDGLYWLTFEHDHELADRIPQMMKLMWAADPDRARLIFDQARFDLPSSVEEYMLQFRGGRIRDLGFEPPSDAPAVFARVDARALRADVRSKLLDRPRVGNIDIGGVAEDLVLRGITPPPLLGDALDRLDDDSRAAFGEAFTFLVNRVFMALTGDPSQVEDLPAAARHAAAILNLGLEYVADEHVETAAGVLERVWPVEVFQAGHSLVHELSLRARRLQRRAGATRGLTLFGAPIDETLHGLALPRPLLFTGLSDEARVDFEPFSRLAELARADVLVADADAVLSFFETQLGFTPARVFDAPALVALSDDERRQIRLATLFRTGLAQLLLVDELRFEPLDRSDLAAFARAAFTKEGGVSPLLSGILERLVAGVPEPVAVFARRAVDDLARAIGAVQADDIDPRFASELFLT